MQFLIIVFFVLLSLGIYLNIRYSKGIEFQKNNKPIEYYDLVKVRRGSYIGESTKIDINYKHNLYSVSIGKPPKFFDDVEKGIIKPRLYYIKENNTVFFEDQYVPYPIVYITYIASVILPLIGFIVYRKELNNNYKTM